MKKKAVSPIIATTLLIMIVIVLALIILLWGKGFVKEAIEKEVAGSKKNVEQFCGEIRVRPIINEVDGSFGFTNIGNIPIYAYTIKLSKEGSSTLTRSTEGNINTGFSTIARDNTGRAYNYYTDADEVKIIPILLGNRKSGGVEEYQCPEDTAILI